jgi:hypothetical protein
MVIVLGAVLVVFAWLQPLHILPWFSWHSELLSFLAVLLLSWYGVASVARSQGPRILAVPAPVIPVAALLCIVFLQGAAGMMHYWGDTLVLAGYLAACVMCLLLG